MKAQMSTVRKVPKKKKATRIRKASAASSAADVKSSSITDVKSELRDTKSVEGNDAKWQDKKKTRAKTKTHPLKHLHQWGQAPSAPTPDAAKRSSDLENAFREGRWSDFVELACKLWVENEKTKEFLARNVLPTIIQRYVGIASFTLMFDVYALAHDPNSSAKMARVIARAISGRQFALANDSPGPYFNRPCSTLNPIRHIEFIGAPTAISTPTAPIPNDTAPDKPKINVYESFAKWQQWISHNKLLGSINPPSGTELYEMAFQTCELMKHLPPFTFFGSKRCGMNSLCDKATEREKMRERVRNHHSADRSVCGDRWSKNLSVLARVLRSFIIEGIGDRVLCIFLLLVISLMSTKTGLHNRVGEMCDAADGMACHDLITLLEARLQSQPEPPLSIPVPLGEKGDVKTAALPLTSTQTGPFQTHLPREDEVPAAWKQTPDWTNGASETFFVREELSRLSARIRQLFLPKPEKKKSPVSKESPDGKTPKSDVAKAKRRKRSPTTEERRDKEISSYLDELDKMAFEEGKNLIRKASQACAQVMDVDAEVQTDHAAVFPWIDPERGPSQETAALGLPHIMLGGTQTAYLDEWHLWIGPYETSCVQDGIDASRAVWRARKMREWGIPVPAVTIMSVGGKPDRFWLRVESPFPVHRWAGSTRGVLTNRGTLGICEWTSLSAAELAQVPTYEMLEAGATMTAMNETKDANLAPPFHTEAKHSHSARIRWALENSPGQQLLAIQTARALLGAADNGFRGGEKAETLIIDMTGTAGTAKKTEPAGSGRWHLVLPLPITRRRIPSGYRQTFWNECCPYGTESRRSAFSAISGVLFGRATGWRDITARNLRDLWVDPQWCRLAAERIRPLLQQVQITATPKKSDTITQLLVSAIPAIFKATPIT